LAFLVCLAHPLTAHAETKTITAEATYTMGDGETPSFAEAQVIQRAKQVALEQAGTYVESYTKVHNYDLTTEEIQTIAGGVMTFEVLDKSRELVGDGLKLSIKIKATVTTDKMEDLAQRIKGKNVAGEYQKLQAEYAKLSREVETWKQLAAKTPVGPERVAALDQIREREKAFVSVQMNEAVLFQRLVAGQALVAESLNKKALVDKLIESIKRDGYVIEIGQISAFPKANQEESLALSVPITVTTSRILSSLLSEAAQSLGGDGLQHLPNYLPRGISDPEEDYFAIVKWEDIQTVNLSNAKQMEGYFSRRIGILSLALEFNSANPKFVQLSCRAPYHVNRVLVTDNSVRDNQIILLSPLVAKRSTEYVSVFLLAKPTKFDVQLLVPLKMAERLGQVTAKWVDLIDAPRNVCDITVAK
jgi:hypothetical protein